MSPLSRGVRRTRRAHDLKQRNAQLEEALREAIEFADEGWAYASDYFRWKWDYEGQRTRLLAQLDPGAQQ